MIVRKLRSLSLHWKKLGTIGLLRYIYSRYSKKSPDSYMASPAKFDLFNHYNYILDDFIGEEFAPETWRNKKTINWVIPDFGISSGGHINIFRYVYYLEKQGYECRIIIVGSCQFASGQAARECIRQYFNPIEAQVSIGSSSLQPAAITIATSWITAYTVHKFRSTGIKCYFVQDFEPYFYSHGSEYFWAEQTYRFRFFGITSGKWLGDTLKKNYGMETESIGFSYDRDLYYPLPRSNPQERQVFFYARPVTIRRGFELGILVLADVARRLPDVKFVLAGWDSSSYYLPFNHIDAGVVALKDLANIYSQCDAALVLSFTNLSLLPLELMACGCPVVSNKGSNVEWLLNDNNSVLVEPTIQALSDALVDLLENKQRRRQLSEAGLEFAQTTNWAIECDKVAKIFDRLNNEL